MRPGEVTLAHNGVLFLDEVAEFRRSTLEALRHALAAKTVCIRGISFPANFKLVATVNLCPCGYQGDQRCACTGDAIRRYHERWKWLRDRDDTVVIPVSAVPTSVLHAGAARGPTSAEIRDQVEKA